MISVWSKAQNRAPELNLPRLFSWTRKGGIAVLDQGLFAGTNFVVNILLARWLEPAQYGAFAVAYSVFLVLSTFHTAVFTEPMLVFGAGKYAERFSKYVALLIRGHWWVSGAIALILALTTLVLWRFHAEDLAQTIAGLAIVSPFILLMWLVRRAFYVLGKPQWSAMGGIVYLALVLAGMYGLYVEHWLSATLALLIMGLACFVVSLWLSAMLQRRAHIEGYGPMLGAVLADHWAYGRWAAATATLNWLPATIFYALLPGWFGLEASGALRAVMNLVMPVLHAHTAVSVLLLPVLVRVLKTGDKATFYRLVSLGFIVFTLGSTCYWAFLAYFRAEIFLWVYGGRYAEYANVLVLAALLPVPVGISVVLGGVLRAMERPDQIFWCHAMAAFVAVTLGLWFMYTHGVTGAVAGSLASSLTVVLSTIGVLWRSSRGARIPLGRESLAFRAGME